MNGLFKSDTLRPAIALAYLTGILPIVRDKVQSKLNNFDEYTILGTKDDVIKMIAGESIDVNVTMYKNTVNVFNTKNNIFTYLIHLGYLSYDESNETCRIPNKEVLKEWANAVSTTSDMR